jgi:CRISPR-associated protein Cas2
MFVVVSYDIADDKRRTRVAKALEGYGTRVQYSVFEVNLPPARIDELRQELAAIMDAQADSIRYYALCAACYERIEVVGIGQQIEGPPQAVII